MYLVDKSALATGPARLLRLPLLLVLVLQLARQCLICLTLDLKLGTASFNPGLAVVLGLGLGLLERRRRSTRRSRPSTHQRKLGSIGANLGLRMRGPSLSGRSVGREPEVK